MFGFIITRHVNSEKTNQYWNLCVERIRMIYGKEYKIIIIDDKSDTEFLKSFHEYENVEIVESEFPGRGELLPYYYFFKNHYFDSAVIIHDSVFFQKKINFEKINDPVLPLWHFEKNKTEQKHHSLSLVEILKNNYSIKKNITNSDIFSHLKINETNWKGCFGVQTFIQHDFLKRIEEKYDLFSLLSVIKNRRDRCCLERIMAVIFYLEYDSLKRKNSLLGDIFNYFQWNYSYENYINHLNQGIIPNVPLVKVWSGR